MKTIKSISKTLVLATALSGLTATAPQVSFAQDAPPPPYVCDPDRSAAARAAKAALPRLGSIPGVGERAGKLLKKVQELTQAEPPNYAEAYAELKDENRLDRWNDTELVAYYQLLASAAQNLDRMDEALVAFKEILKLEKLSNTQRDQFTYIVGQIEFSMGNYAVAEGYINDWYQYQATPSITQIEFLGNVQYTIALETENEAAADPYFRRALGFLECAVEKANAEGKADKENWYQVLRAIHNTLGETDKVVEYAELLTSRWPKKQYWTQLSSVYAQKAGTDGLSEAEVASLEKRQLAAFEMAHRQGMLDSGREMETMAQLYLYHESPYQSQKVIGKALEEGLSERTKRNLELYATGLVTGKDLEESIVPLAEAAAMADDGNLYLQLANVNLNLDNYEAAAEALTNALDKGGLRRPDQASLLQGQAYLALEDFDKARESFREALKDDRSETHARNFLRYVDSEERRIKDIREYLS